VSGSGNGESDGLHAGRHYLAAGALVHGAGEQDLDTVAASAYMWYQKHCAAAQAKRYATAIFGSGSDGHGRKCPRSGQAGNVTVSGFAGAGSGKAVVVSAEPPMDQGQKAIRLLIYSHYFLAVHRRMWKTYVRLLARG
jgi:hypothetical protein